MEVTDVYLSVVTGTNTKINNNQAVNDVYERAQMAQRTQVLLIDDLDGSSAEETVAFGLDGSAYEIDLSSKNANQLRKSLASYVAKGRKSALARQGAKRRASVAPVRTASAGDIADVRSWARSNGYSVNDRGRLARDIVEAYHAAH